MKKSSSKNLSVVGCAVAAVPFVLGLYAKYIANPAEKEREKKKEDFEKRKHEWSVKDEAKMYSVDAAHATRFEKRCVAHEDENAIPVRVNLRQVMMMDEDSKISGAIDEIRSFCDTASRFEYQASEDQVRYFLPRCASGVYACGYASEKSICVDSSKGLRELQVSTNAMGRYLVVNTISTNQYVISLVQVDRSLDVNVTNYILNAKGFLDVYRAVLVYNNYCSSNLLRSNS